MAQEFHRAFHELRQTFIQGLPERARKLEQAWTHLHRLNWNEQSIRALQQFFHKLGGSSANYGLGEISSSAQYLADYLQDMLELRRQLGANERDHIHQKISRLKQQMQHAELSESSLPLLAAPTLTELSLAAINQHSIYVIEADGGHASLLCSYLRKAGFNARAFESAADCIAHPHEYSPQAILLDADLHPDGVLAVIRSLKSLFDEPVSVLLMSARSDANTRLRAMRAGGDDYLIKPIDLNLLLEKLLRALRQPERRYRVMVVDDDPHMSSLEAEILRNEGMEVLAIERPLQSLQMANSFHPDLVILDMHMPEINGIELAKLLRQDPEFLLLPIIFVTADTDLQLHQQIRALGVNALLVKPLQADQLVHLCQQALASTASLKNRVARITQRSYQAHQITPGYFFSAVEEEIHSHNLHEEKSAVYYLSPSHYPELVEQLDRVDMSNLHQAFCDYLGEILGADEHWVELSPLVACVLARRRSLQYHLQRGEQLAKQLGQHLFQVSTDNSLRIGFGLGVVSLEPGLVSAHQAIMAAEENYELQTGRLSKHLTRLYANEAPLAIPQLSDALSSEQENLSRAITREVQQHKTLRQEPAPLAPLPLDINKDLLLTFQPIISLEASQIEHFSVLTRLRRSDGELIPASQFLHQLEQPGKRLELDRWVLQKAVSTLADDSSTRENATLFIHLDRDTLVQKSFFSFAANVLRSSRLRGSARLIFMLEEPWVAAHLEQAQQLTQALLDIGCGSCLTQAGTTANSAQLIERLPLHYLRLSPKLTGQGYDKAQLKAILDAAKRNRVEAIATQIEDSHSLSALWMQGIRLFEGFFIQAPDSVFRLHNDIIFAKEFVQQQGFNAIN